MLFFYLPGVKFALSGSVTLMVGIGVDGTQEKHPLDWQPISTKQVN